MSSKRKIDDFDPNKSDSDDEDFDITAVATSSRSKKKTKGRRQAKTTQRRGNKRQRNSYSDDDIEPDSDEIEEDSFEQSSEEEEEEAPVNPKTGRRMRGAARTPKKYEEISEDEIEASESDTAPPPKNQKPSLVIKLKVPSLQSGTAGGKRTARSRTGSKDARALSETPTAAALRTRRSSRISHDEQEPLVALTDSGRNLRVTRRGTATPEPPASHLPSRMNRGGPGFKTVPSVVMEASQEEEEIPASQSFDPESNDFISQLREHAEVDTAVDPSEGGSPLNQAIEVNDDEQQDEPVLISDIAAGAAPKEEEADADEDAEEDADADADAEDDDDEPVVRGFGRSLRSRAKPESPSEAVQAPASAPPAGGRSLRSRKPAAAEHSDFEPDAEEEDAGDENISSADELQQSRPKSRRSDNDSSSGTGVRRSTRLGKRSRSRRESGSDDSAHGLDPDELADEAAALKEDRRERSNKRPRRTRANEEAITFEGSTLRNRNKRPDYRIYRPELALVDDEEALVAPSASQRPRRGAAPWRSLFSTLGPFGGAGGPAPVFGGPEGTGAAGGVDSDSSDDDMPQRMPRPSVGGAVGMTPTSAAAPSLFPQSHNADATHGGAGGAGGPANFGKVKDKKALADADPLGVDPNVSFEGVGGLDDHIDRLKEMVALPLLYPEVFQRFHVTPPRGVLFHGPPGTGKTLLARALASSVSAHGKKVTFYMRKGADALSKWVGEAERQLRLLFEEARKNQPSIIFFDEIDGLAPVRSSKQEQIHASIVATLLALMDGMDGRGQVIVIGATNRPDSVDPALRRPGRFDREFYFPLPSQPARRAIIDIHTKGWEPPLQPEFKDSLAEITKGYGGADLRALCTEAALNAVQGTFPQIYASNKKLLIDPSKIKVLAKDFMISVKKIVPSSERSASTGAAPLKKSIEPLLRESLAKVQQILDEIIPQKKKPTALEEAMYDDRDDEKGFEKETMHREFESARIFRPRLLIRGLEGMGQQYISAALLSKFEGLHVSNFDLPTLLKDSTRSPEAAVVQLFEEVKRHKPSVIYIPDVDTWYSTLSDSVIRTFIGLLKSLPPTDPVLLLGVSELGEGEKSDPEMVRKLFGYSLKNSFVLDQPSEPARREYFGGLLKYIQQSPDDFPDPANRKRRQLEELPEAPTIEEPKGPTKEQLKAQKKQDRHTLNMLKLHVQQVMDQIKLKYKKFRTPPIDEKQIEYLFDEQDPNVFTTDLGHQEAAQQMYRPYELDKDDKGVGGLRETASGKFYYNLEIVTIEKRLSNGYYKRPKDFLADIKRLAKDARVLGDAERTLKANEMVANVEVDMTNLEQSFPALVAECEAVFLREQAREKQQTEKVDKAFENAGDVPRVLANVPAQHTNGNSEPSSAPVMLGEDVPQRGHLPPFSPAKTALSNGFSISDGSNGRQSNGSTIPSRLNDDTEMTDSHDGSHHSFPQDHTHLQPFHTASAPNIQMHRLTQSSGHTQLVPGASAKDYHNSASTTTSDRTGSRQRNSDHSAATNGSSRPSDGLVREGDVPDFSALHHTGGSQLPDTQPEHFSSQTQSQPSQSSPKMGPPALGNRASLLNLLNNPTDTNNAGTTDLVPAPAARQQAQPLVHVIPADPTSVQTFYESLVSKSSGCTVEQLEQVMAALMDAVWRTRGLANRGHALMAVRDTFNATIMDIMACQELLDPSQPSLKSAGRE